MSRHRTLLQQPVEVRYNSYATWYVLSGELDFRGAGDGRQPISDVHQPVVLCPPSLFWDVALRVNERGYLKKKKEKQRVRSVYELTAAGKKERNKTTKNDGKATLKSTVVQVSLQHNCRAFPSTNVTSTKHKQYPSTVILTLVPPSQYECLIPRRG